MMVQISYYQKQRMEFHGVSHFVFVVEIKGKSHINHPFFQMEGNNILSM